MASWYCVVGGQQYGPVDDAALRDWIQQGRLGPQDMVWTMGMPQWVPAASVPGLFVDGHAPPAAAANSLATVAPPQGTGGRTSNADLMAQARESLKGNWGMSIVVCLVAGLLQGGGCIPLVGPIIGLLLAGPLTVGLNACYLTLTRRGRLEFEMLFRGFRHFGNALCAFILMILLIFLWTLLLIIPGIIASYAYSQTFYLMAEDTSLSASQAIAQSKRLMQGHKWKLFCLGWRFFGWALLCILTCGIGFLFLQPYMAASFARFHDDVHGTGQTATAAPL